MGELGLSKEGKEAEGAAMRVDSPTKKPNFVASGIVKLPPGFRFHPTDEELVVQYLKRKVFSCPLPASIIPEIDVSKFDPWDLPGDSERERYFFTKRVSKYPNGSRANRASGSGCWKATGTDRSIVASKTNLVVGLKKVLVFYRGKSPRGSRTDWIMHEYRLSDAATKTCITPQRKNSLQSCNLPIEDWVICRIFLKKRSIKDDVELNHVSAERAQGVRRTVLIDFMSRRNTGRGDVVSSDSESSSISELSSAGRPNEEMSSFNGVSSSYPSGRDLDAV